MTTRDRPVGRGRPDDMPLSLHHIVVDAHDLPALARVLRPGGLVLAALHAGEEVRHRDSWFDRPVSLDFFALRPEDVAAGLADAGFALAATLMRGPYPGEADTERAYLLARRL